MTMATSTKGKLARNFTQTPKANQIVEEAKARGENLSTFISQCIEDYGPLLLDGKEGKGKGAPFAARFKFIEETVVAWAYDELVEDWDAPVLKAHQEILKSTGKKSWYNAKSLKAIMDAAEKNSKTKNTEARQWQALLQRREDFLARQ